MGHVTLGIPFLQDDKETLYEAEAVVNDTIPNPCPLFDGWLTGLEALASI